MAVADVHVDVLHVLSATADEAVKSELPKLSPLTVTDSAPLAAMFTPPYETTGPSNVKPSACVPPTAPTVTSTAVDRGGGNTLLRQPTDVWELHITVEHTADDIVLLTVKSTFPKLSPVTVTDIPPLSPRFETLYDTAGPSKLIPDTMVPPTAPTVTTSSPKEDPVAAALLHCTLVPLDQLAVVQSTPDSTAV